MTLQKYGMAIFFIFACLFVGCKIKDNPVAAQKLPSYLFGQVVDQAGNPVEGCGVHYIFSFTNSALRKENKIYPASIIQYSIPSRSKVTLKIFRWYTNDTIATLIDDTLEAGSYSTSLDVSKITNGIYLYQLKIDTTVQEKTMTILNSDLSSLANTNPLISTYSSGAFVLPYGVFGFGVPLTQATSSGTSTETVYISHSIQIILTKTGYAPCTKVLTIDETQGINQTFTMMKL